MELIIKSIVNENERHPKDVILKGVQEIVVNDKPVTIRWRIDKSGMEEKELSVIDCMRYSKAAKEFITMLKDTAALKQSISSRQYGNITFYAFTDIKA